MSNSSSSSISNIKYIKFNKFIKFSKCNHSDHCCSINFVLTLLLLSTTSYSFSEWFCLAKVWYLGTKLAILYTTKYFFEFFEFFEFEFSWYLTNLTVKSFKFGWNLINLTFKYFKYCRVFQVFQIAIEYSQMLNILF